MPSTDTQAVSVSLTTYLSFLALLTPKPGIFSRRELCCLCVHKCEVAAAIKCTVFVYRYFSRRTQIVFLNGRVHVKHIYI